MAATSRELTWAVAVGALLLAGCATSPVPRPASGEPAEPVSIPEAEEPAEAEPRRDPRVEAAPLVVVVDDAGGRTLEVLQVFSARLGRPYRILDLAHRPRESVSARLARDAPVDVIALGATAVATAGGIPGVRVVHAGAFAVGAGTPGVDALPPFDVQLDYWRQVNPELRRIGVIGGEAMASRMRDLAAACVDRGMILEQRTVGSDQEMLLAFRALVPRIDGFVFLPDGSVLSPGVIEQIIDHGRRNDVQTLVYSPVMFNLGATLYLEPDPVRVAQALIAALEQQQAGIASVREMRVRSRLDGTLALSSVGPEPFQLREGAAF